MNPRFTQEQLDWIEEYERNDWATLGKDLGTMRQALRPDGTGTPRFFEDPNAENIVGATGEVYFGKLYGLSIDETARPGGDGGYDFVIRWRGQDVTIDVKAARHPKYLFLKVGKEAQCAHILVLGGFGDDGVVSFIGWAGRDEIVPAPTREFGHGIENHYIAADKLRSMKSLTKIMNERER